MNYTITKLSFAMLIMSLSGGSGSGKTSLANEVLSRFPKGFITLFPMDAYYKDHAYLNDQEKKQYNFDHPRAMDFKLITSHLQSLRSGDSIEMPVYSFISSSRQSYTIPVRPSGIVLLEGFMALINKNLREITDLKIFIHASESIRLERIVSRDEKERGRSRQMAEERFYKTVQPMHNRFIEPYKRFADVVLDGDHDSIPQLTDKVENLISEWLQKYSYKSGINP